MVLRVERETKERGNRREKRGKKDGRVKKNKRTTSQRVRWGLYRRRQSDISETVYRTLHTVLELTISDERGAGIHVPARDTCHAVLCCLRSSAVHVCCAQVPL